MKITVKKLIEELSKYPEDALCYAYEGSTAGVVIVADKEIHKSGDREELGFILASE